MQLVVIAGPAGSGKSTLADALAEELAATHLDFDAVTTELVQHRKAENQHLSEPELLEKIKGERYLELARAIRGSSEQVIIASGPFSQHSQNAEIWHRWVHECGWEGSVHFFWLDVDPEIRRLRILERGSSRDVRIMGSPRGLEPVPLPVFPCHRVEAGAPTATQVRAVLNAIL